MTEEQTKPIPKRRAQEITFPLTLWKPPAYNGDEWTEETYNSPEELLVELERMRDEYTQKAGTG